jgi:5-(carboxyamino)imidazole ribonucleotide synthase
MEIESNHQLPCGSFGAGDDFHAKSIRRVGVIGGGQLAWMMAGAAEKLGISLIVQTPHVTDPAVAIAAHTILAPIADAAATEAMAQQCDVITFENEFVDLDALSSLATQGVCFRPSLDTLKPILDKYHQRLHLQNLDLPTPAFRATSVEELLANPGELAFPCVLKTRRHGYDGQGTFILKQAADFAAIIDRLRGVPLVWEAFVPFERELAMIAARSVTGEVRTYPVVETEQENQVCKRVFAPAILASPVHAQVETIAHKLLTGLHAVGVFGIELFLTAEGQVLVNEIAPRTHNSGHYTLDACDVSQFEQHLRAVCGFALGETGMRSPGAVMVNLLGYEHSTHDYREKREHLAKIPHAHLHWYGKGESRLGRKLGHLTVLLDEASMLDHSQGFDHLNTLNHTLNTVSVVQPRDRALAIAETIETIWSLSP